MRGTNNQQGFKKFASKKEEYFFLSAVTFKGEKFAKFGSMTFRFLKNLNRILRSLRKLYADFIMLSIDCF